ncbi:MAG: tetratricopeptide repeat protein [Planctomycetota bacterium]|nr:tetratricopeptide repeat protein [Planctomycetota bacterium]
MAANDLSLALAAFNSGDLNKAEQLARRAAGARPTPDSLSLLGTVLRERGQPAQSATLQERAIALDPSCFSAWLNLAAARRDTGELAEAERAARRACDLDPRHASALVNLSVILLDQGKLADATDAIRRAAELEPARADLWKELARNLQHAGRCAEAAHAFKRAFDCNNADPRPAMAMLMALNYVDSETPETVSSVHRQFGDWFAASAGPLQPPPRLPRTGPEPRTIGLLSPDFRAHSCAAFMLPLMTALRAEGFVVRCYSQTTVDDETSRRMKSLASSWELTSGQRPAAAAQLIRRGEVDVLIDLAGHTFGARMDICLERPAPLMLTYLGYPNTTGLPCFDGRIVDAITDPPGSEHLMTEAPARVEGCFLCYEPRPEIRARGPIPRRPGGPFTFAAFAQLPKMSPTCVATWARAVAAAPADSRLLVKAPYLEDPRTWERFRLMFESAGGPPGALVRAPYVASFAEHLDSYQSVDLILDTFPYNGTTTTCEQLASGVPVLTMSGAAHASRVGASLLTAAGLPELLTRSSGDFVARAARFASDPAALSALRQSLHARVAASSLCDVPGFGRRFARMLREAWQSPPR